MSIGSTTWRMCEGKQRYDEATAKERAAQHNARRRRSEPRLQAFPCSCCPFWHIGGHKQNTKALRRGGV